MTEKAYTVSLTSGIECEDGHHFTELVCVAEDKSVIRIVLPTTNLCEYMPFGDSHRCNECEYKEKCEIQAPYEVELGRKLVIVDRGEFVQDRKSNIDNP